MNRHNQILTALAVVSLGACDSGAETGLIIGELASDRVELTAEAGEPVIEILVNEGEAVVAGQVLLHQDTSRATARLAEAQAATREAQARLDELVRGPRSELIAAARANVSGAARELEFRKSEHARLQELKARNLTSAESLDRARAALDAAQANDGVRRAQLQELLTGTTIEELAQAEHAVAQASARHDLLTVDLERHRIVAPVDGIVDSRLFEVGERPNPGQPLLILLPGEQPHARVYIPEQQRVAVRVGDNVTVRVDGLADSVSGRVRWIASESMFTPYFALTERDRGHLTYAAKIDLQVNGKRLPDGVPVTVER
jgi:HlyD family secretion protein